MWGRQQWAMTVAATAGILVVVNVSAGAARPHASRVARRVSRTSSARRRLPSQAPVAAGLARRVSSAHTAPARYKALLAVMRAFRIGVYTTAGHTVARGAERGPKDFYTYDVELRALASGLEQKRTWSLADLAGELSHAGLGVGGQPVTAEQLKTAIVKGTRAAKSSPRNVYSLAPLLVRDLGLRHSYDTASDFSVDSMRLDALQRAVLIADVVVAAERSQASGALLGASPAKAKCPLEEITQGPHRAGWKIGKWLVEKYGIKTVKGITKHLLELLHAALLAQAIDFHEVKQGEVTDTHYGPAANHPGYTEPHYPGRQLVYTVEVDMSAHLAEKEPDAIACGALVGLKFPPPGPVKGVPIVWRTLLTSQGYDQLLEHGTITSQDETGSDGRATLRFTPSDEAVPGFGTLHTAEGVLQPGANVIGAFGNGPADLVEDALPIFTTLTAWSVEYHKPRGFKFAEVVYPPAPAHDYTFHLERWGVEAHVCGADPYAAPWSGTWHRLETDQGGNQRDTGFGRTFDNWVFVPGQTSVPKPPFYAVDDPGDEIQGELVRGTPPDPPLMARLRVKQTPPTLGGPIFATVTVPVEEDLSCPDNP